MPALWFTPGERGSWRESQLYCFLSPGCQAELCSGTSGPVTSDLSLLPCSSEHQRPPSCGPSQGPVSKLPLFSMGEHQKKERNLWSVMWQTGKDMRTHSSPETFFLPWISMTLPEKTYPRTVYTCRSTEETMGHQATLNLMTLYWITFQSPLD